jgi:hypothetical protein
MTENVDRRWTPRGPDDGTQIHVHDVRFAGVDGGVRAHCDEDGWRVRLADGHTAGDLTRLTRQHSGYDDGEMRRLAEWLAAEATGHADPDDCDCGAAVAGRARHAGLCDGATRAQKLARLADLVLAVIGAQP